MNTKTKSQGCILAFLLTLISSQQLSAQQEKFKKASLDHSLLNQLSLRYRKLDDHIRKASLHLLQRNEKQELSAIRHKQWYDSSFQGKALQDETIAFYQQLKDSLNAPLKTAPVFYKAYRPSLDSIQTAIGFLAQFGPSANSLPGHLDAAATGLNNRFDEAAGLQQLLAQRQSQWWPQLASDRLNLPPGSMRKQLYYYSQQLNDLKTALEDCHTLEDKIMARVRDLPAFQSFMRTNSYAALLFRLPDNYGTSASMNGLQTKEQVQQLLGQRIGNAVADPAQFVQQQTQLARQQLTRLQDKVNQLGNSSAADLDMPDFRPNGQKTKTFLQRLEYGFNMQSTGAGQFLPSTLDLGASLGYKLSDKSTAGIGASYKLGLGRPINNLRLSSQGLGFRSYADIKAKGNIWISGGAEYNYLQAISKISNLNDPDVWQESILLGLTKKYRMGKINGNLQLLYDFLAHRQVPAAPPFKFRLGYTF